MTLYSDILAYQPVNDQEAADRALMLRALAEDPACFDRSAGAHFTCSAWVVNPARTQTLMVYHKIYDSWSWIGGHADGCEDLAAVALRELAEETGACGQPVAAPAAAASPIFSLEALPVAGHIRRGEYVSSHVHLNVTYLVEVPLDAPLRENPDENAGVRWVPLEDVCRVSSEPWMCRLVYQKLIDKLK